MAKKETVQFRTPQTEDRFGDPVGEANAWRPVAGCTVVPRSTDEYEKRGTILIQGYFVRAPAGTEIGNTDDVEVRGEVYKIDGVVGDYGRKGKMMYVGRVV